MKNHTYHIEQLLFDTVRELNQPKETGMTQKVIVVKPYIDYVFTDSEHRAVQLVETEGPMIFQSALLADSHRKPQLGWKGRERIYIDDIIGQNKKDVPEEKHYNVEGRRVHMKFEPCDTETVYATVSVFMT